MKNVLNIARVELQKMFYSPIAWFVLFMFAAYSGIEFVKMASEVITYFSGLGYELEGAPAGITSYLFASENPPGFFITVQTIFFLAVPLITMGLMSKEFSSGSINWLYASPVTNTQIILGKYFAAVVMCFIMVLILLIQSLFCFVFIEDFEFTLVLSGLLGIFLLLITYAAIGLFISCLTSYQLIALFGSVGIIYLLGQMSKVGQTVEELRKIAYWMSIGNRSNNFVFGMITSDDVLYFLLITLLFLCFSIFRLKSLREKSTKLTITLRYVGTFLAVVALGYITSRPGLKQYYDVTANEVNTLTEKSQEVMNGIQEKVKVTKFGNFFGGKFYLADPMFTTELERFFEQYQRFHPDIEFETKYYYAPPVEPAALRSFENRFKDMTDEQIIEQVASYSEIDPDDANPAEAYADIVDTEKELNRFFWKLETESGKESYLRVFNDPPTVPFENQIAAAFKKLTDNVPVAGFVTGHRERDINGEGTQGYFSLTQEKPNRYSLINNGVDFQEVSLKQPVPSAIDVLFLAENRSALSEIEIKHLNEYLDAGGDFILLTDVGRQDVANPILSKFGVTALPGQIAEYNKGYTMDFVTARTTPAARKLAYQLQNLFKSPNDSSRGEAVVAMNGAVGLSYEEKPGYTYTPMLYADSIVNIPARMSDAELEKLKAQYADSEGASKSYTEEEINMMEFEAESSGEESEFDIAERESKAAYKGSWVETQTTDFIDTIATLDEEAGDIAGPITTALGIQRTVNGKEQKIVIVGDADCLSNQDMNSRKLGIQALNYLFSDGIIHWVTDGEAPSDTRRPVAKDLKATITKEKASFFYVFYKFILPGLFVIALIVIWARRRGR